MMKTLRRKFVVFAMSVVTILLLFFVGAINGFHYMILEGQSDRVLHTLVNANGMFMQMDFNDQTLLAPPPNMDVMKSIRFFMVRTDKDGRVLDVNSDQISSVSAEMAENYAKQVKETSGRIDGYKYLVKPVGSERLIFFMDNSGQWNTFIMMLIVSSVIAFICWLVILLFAILISERIVRPIIAATEKQKQFITNAGHELKTPLAIIQSNNDAMMLLHGENKYNNNIKLQTQRLNMLMTNLLTLAKLDEEAKLPTESVNISELIVGMFPAYKDMAANRQIALLVEIMPDIHIQAHKDTFMQMITVLLDNAVKYTPDGGQILLSLIYEDNHIWLTEENSCEMPQENNPERLFERFYRGDDARTQNSTATGYGIGLSAARAIVETFGGKLTAEYPTLGKIRFTARF